MSRNQIFPEKADSASIKSDVDDLGVDKIRRCS